MVRIEELDSERATSVNLSEPSLDADGAPVKDPRTHGATTAPTLPPSMQPFGPTDGTANLLESMNRTPLFMTSLDESDGEGGTNASLEALRALAYEGTPYEIADNFREHGNENHAAKKWADAVEFYSKGLEALSERGKRAVAEGRIGRERGELEAEADAWEANQTDEERADELKSERVLEERLLLNRAACNLELQNYRRVINDTTILLSRNPSLQKAHYRLALAHLSLRRPADALAVIANALPLFPTSQAPLLAVQTRANALLAEQTARETAAARVKAEQAAKASNLAVALRTRGILTRRTAHPPADLPDDVKIHLSTPSDATSTVNIPLMFLYPLRAQSDLVRAFPLDTTLNEHLDYLLPPPWDADGKEGYRKANVQAFVTTPTAEHPHKLLQVGKNLALEGVLREKAVVVEDGLLRVMLVPKGEVERWLGTWKERAGRGGS